MGGGGSSDDDEDEAGEVASSWLSPAEKTEEKKNALTVMSPAKEERGPETLLSPEDEETEKISTRSLRR